MFLKKVCEKFFCTKIMVPNFSPKLLEISLPSHVWLIELGEDVWKILLMNPHHMRNYEKLLGNHLWSIFLIHHFYFWGYIYWSFNNFEWCRLWYKNKVVDHRTTTSPCKSTLHTCFFLEECKHTSFASGVHKNHQVARKWTRRLHEKVNWGCDEEKKSKDPR